MMSFTWTCNRVEKLRALWGKKPAGAIAVEIGATRNQAIGKANRLNLPPISPKALSEFCAAAQRRRFSKVAA